MCNYACMEKLAPKKFLCCLELRTGAIIIAILLNVAMIVCIIATAVQVSYLGSEIHVYDLNITFTKRNSYAFSIIAVIYSLILLAVGLWGLYGVVMRKTTILIGWLTVLCVWLAKILCLLFVSIYLHSLKNSFISWIFALIFGLICFGVLVYCVLVILGYYFELKRVKEEN